MSQNQGGLPALGTRSREAVGGKIIQMTNSPKDARVGDIAGQLCDLLDQQMKTIVGKGLQDLTEEDLTGYELRRTQIAALRSQLNGLAYPN